MATLSQWIDGARPRTLPAAVAPVLVGTGAAYALGSGDPAAALLAAIVALALQVGVNYANDYSDGIRGTDDERVGPVRLVGQKLAGPASVKLAAFACFGIAALAGLSLVTLTDTPELLLVGLAAILAAWFYTGGSRPYGYLGLGEVFVFVFFGLVAVLGTTWTQAEKLDTSAWAGAVGVGAISCAVLVANNLRDIPGDREVGKRTLAVRLGENGTRVFFQALIGVSVLCVLIIALSRPWALIALVALVPAVVAVRTVASGARGRDLIPVLASTGGYLLAYGVLLGAGLFLSR